VSQLGLMASPRWLKTSDTNLALRAKPVGTGPFVFESYSPNGSFKARRNPNYWNKPYPYLDEVELRPIADAGQRNDALKTGSVDIFHTTAGRTIKGYEGSTNPVVDLRTYKGPTAYSLLHVAASADPAKPNPLADRRVRCALANAADAPSLIRAVGAGVDHIANGPISPQQVGYLADTGYPQHQDLAQAKALIAAYKDDHAGPLVLSLATTNDATNLIVAQFQKQWYEEAGVDRVVINQVDQAAFILAALKGDFQTFQWRNHAGVDLDSQYVWWHSSTALPDGQLGLNYGRIRDPVIDRALDDNRSTTDVARKQADAETVNRRFADQCYDLWAWWTTWAVIHDANLHIPADDALPGGGTTGHTNEIVDLATVWKG
jgi:peptide/nickel transport system substrate-binding protein